MVATTNSAERYIIKDVNHRNITRSDMIYMLAVGRHLSKRYGHKFNADRFNLAWYLDNGRITMCMDMKGDPVGLMMAQLYPSVFDPDVKILRQDLLYAPPASRALKMLLDDFIDFGKSNADHILTMIGEHTNLKESSLEKMGFEKLETLYRLET